MAQAPFRDGHQKRQLNDPAPMVIVGRPLGPPMTRAIFSGDTMVQVGQTSLHGPRETGYPHTVQVKAAPVRARDVRPDKLRSHRPTVGGVIDLAGMVSHHVYEPPTREVTEPVQARISPWLSQGSDVIVLELLQRLRLLTQRPLTRVMPRCCTRNCRNRLIVFRELPRAKPT